MKKQFGLAVSAAIPVAFAFAAPAQAATTIGGYNFDDNAFVDTLVGSFGNYTVVGGTLSSVLTDTDAGTYAYSFDGGAFLDLAFTDNVAINGAGNDLVLFEMGNVLDGWNVTIGGVTLPFLPVDTGFDEAGFNLDAAAFDLTAFGIAPGGEVSSLRLSFAPAATVASTSLVGALNSAPVGGAVPEPATWAMMILGFGAIGGMLRRSRRREVAMAA